MPRYIGAIAAAIFVTVVTIGAAVALSPPGPPSVVHLVHATTTTTWEPPTTTTTGPSLPVVAPPAPVPAPAPPRPVVTVHANWDRIAQCETGGNWRMVGSTYSGGVGFANTTWDGFGGRQFASRAGYASREQQIIVAERVYARYGLSGWGCRRYG